MLSFKIADSEAWFRQLKTLTSTSHPDMFNDILHVHYKIIKVLGLGRSGITYLAQDIDTIDSPFVIIKEIQHPSQNRLTPSLVNAFFNAQGSIAHKVGQHPQIPSVVAKFTEDGHRYLVREYIDGEPLSQELTPGLTWDQTQVFDFLMDLIGILCFVHSFGYIHQDLNPHNIIRNSHDQRFNLIGFSGVKDLGIDRDMPGHYPINCNNSVYIPYEQEQNAPHFNSDIYAVGAIAIQALTGKFPLTRDPDSYEFNWQDQVKIDQKLIKIIDRMVRPDYRNRYQSGLEVLTDLQSFALTQIPPPKSERFRPYLIFGTAACFLLGGVGITKLFSAATNKPQSPPLVTTPKIVTPRLQNTANWKQYADPSTGVNMKYAKDWTKDEIPNILTGETVTFSNSLQKLAGKYPEHISIRVEDWNSPKLTLATYTQLAIAQINQHYPNAKIIESSPTTLAHKPARLIVYTGQDEHSRRVKNLEVWTIDRGKVYIITYKAEVDQYYQHLETAMTMINSFDLD
jgi:eukaryotic-like serine/threonine-protein kinase